MLNIDGGRTYKRDTNPSFINPNSVFKKVSNIRTLANAQHLYYKYVRACL